jgi:hypothetical protein
MSVYYSNKEIPACQAIVRHGTELYGYRYAQCGMAANKDSEFCYHHMPDRERLRRLLRKQRIDPRWVFELQALLRHRHVLDVIAEL